MVNLRIVVLLAALSACASGKPQYAGDPPPATYRTVMAGDFLQRFNGQYSVATVSISQPQPGARDIMNGWRVCVQATPKTGGDPVAISYFFIDRHIANVTAGDAQCIPFSYEPWPELDHAEGWKQ